jgi:hypothetical protein
MIAMVYLGEEEIRRRAPRGAALSVRVRGRRHDALPPSDDRAASDECGIFVDNDDGARGTLTHGASRIVGQHRSRDPGGLECVLDLSIFGPVRRTDPTERQRDPTMSDPAVGRRLDPERSPDRCGDRRMADHPDLETTHRAK